MASVNELDDLMKSMERELLDLKTNHAVKSDLKTFQQDFYISGSELYAPPHLYRVTYEDGPQPIISFVTDLDAIMGSETANTQLLITPALFFATTMTVLSTRPIKSIVMIA